MLGHIGNLHTHAAFALVDDEAAVLENGVYLFALVVEVVEGNKVAKQTVEVAVYMEELVDKSIIFNNCTAKLQHLRQTQKLLIEFFTYVPIIP